jgi:cardiolipin synthase C
MMARFSSLAALFLLATSLAHAAAVPGRTQFLDYNPKSWFARFKILKEARRSILVQYFILSEDIFGESFLGLLLEKARAGLEVKLMLDARGSFTITHGMLGRALLRELVQAGAEVKVFNPFFAEGLTGDFVSSNHQKIILVDDRVFMTGGRNVAQEYFLDEVELPRTFHDADVLIDSPELAPAVRAAFMEEYNTSVAHPLAATGTFGDLVDHAPRLLDARRAMEDRLNNIFLRRETQENHPELTRWPFMRMFEPFIPFRGCDGCHNESFDDVDYGPTTAELNTPNPITLAVQTASVTSGRREITAMLKQQIRAARQEILIQNPYVVLPPDMKKELENASRRGVRVVISTNGPFSSDNPLVQSAFFNDWKTLARDIVNSITFVHRGFRQVHSKCFVFDGKRSIVGSYNLDNLSDHINSEIAVLVDSEAFSKRVAASIHEQMEMESLELRLDGRHPEQIRGWADVVSYLRGVYTLAGHILRPLL